MKRIALGFALAAALAAPSVTHAQDGEGRRLALLAFSSLDTAERGFVDQGEFLTFGGDVFYSMDNDRSGDLSLTEFMSWDYGMRPTAEAAGREDAYETALRIVFSFWDRDGDGVISATEHRQSLMADFRRADSNNDALLNEDEFTRGFSVMVALRAAIHPAPLQ